MPSFNPSDSSPTSASLPPQRSETWLRGLVFTSLFAALFIAGSAVKIPLAFSAVPVTLQTLAVMIAGGLLGATYGLASILVVVVLTALGLPLMHGNGGLAFVFGPTGGFILSFPIAAWLIGWASDRLFPPGRRRLTPLQYALLALAIAAFGVCLPYLLGVPWLGWRASLPLSDAIQKGMVLFLPGDAIKAAAAVLLIASLRPAMPRLRPSAPGRNKR